MRTMHAHDTYIRSVVWPAAALLVAVLIRVGLDPVLGNTVPFVTVYGAIALAQWSGGWRSATLVAFGGYALCNYLFVAPRHELVVPSVALAVGAAAYLVTSGVIIGFGELARRAQRDLLASQRELFERVSVLDRTMATLHESEAVFRTIGEAVPDFLWLAEADGTPIYQNPAWARYIGMTPEEFAVAGWSSLHPPDDQQRATDAWTEAVRNEEPFAVDLRVRRRDGVLRWFHCRTVPLHDDAGVLRKWVGTMTDIDELKRAEQNLSDAAQRKDEFLALLSHELRNPLAPLRSAVDVLRLQTPPSAATAGLYDMMERQLVQLVRLVDDLLEISRISSGTLKLRRESVAVESIVQSAIETAAPMLAKARHTLTTSMDQPAAIIDGDVVRLAQVLTNLLTNAIRYTPDGGRIHIGTRTSVDSVAICVTDNGIGIPPAELPHVFEMFTRGRNTMLVREGLGVGLSLAAQLTAMHGGRIEAESDGAGRGSRFTVYLPCRLAHDAAERAALRTPTAVTARRILIVDDNADAGESLGMLLQCLGAEVSVARSGAGALAMLPSVQPSLVLLDLGMPEMDGFDVLRAMRAKPEGRHIQVVALTGWGQDRDRERVAAAGFDGHLVKPVDLRALDALLTSELSDSAAPRAGAATS